MKQLAAYDSNVQTSSIRLVFDYCVTISIPMSQSQKQTGPPKFTDAQGQRNSYYISLKEVFDKIDEISEQII